jgi:type I restriction enzyme M protein
MKDAIPDPFERVDAAEIINPMLVLRQVAGQSFYNTSDFTLRQGESNIRRLITVENWQEAIVDLILNIRYKFGIAIYSWVLMSCKPAHRWGRMQLIDGTQLYKPLRRNLGQKNCELSGEVILSFEKTGPTNIFLTTVFGYLIVTLERQLSLVAVYLNRPYNSTEIKESLDPADNVQQVIRKTKMEAQAA